MLPLLDNRGTKDGCDKASWVHSNYQGLSNVLDGWLRQKKLALLDEEGRPSKITVTAARTRSNRTRRAPLHLLGGNIWSSMTRHTMDPCHRTTTTAKTTTMAQTTAPLAWRSRTRKCLLKENAMSWAIQMCNGKLICLVGMRKTCLKSSWNK